MSRGSSTETHEMLICKQYFANWSYSLNINVENNEPYSSEKSNIAPPEDGLRCFTIKFER
jgi:hypothetical protein